MSWKESVAMHRNLFEFGERLFDFETKNLGNCTKSQTLMRSLYYYALNPNEKIPANAIRRGEHKDWGMLTFVMQDLVGGLEVNKLGILIEIYS